MLKLPRFLIAAVCALSCSFTIPAFAAPQRPAVCTEIDATLASADASNVNVPGAEWCYQSNMHGNRLVVGCYLERLTSCESVVEWMYILSVTLELCYPKGQVTWHQDNATVNPLWITASSSADRSEGELTLTLLEMAEPNRCGLKYTFETSVQHIPYVYIPPPRW